MQLVYNGPHDSVEVPDAGIYDEDGNDAVIVRGNPVEVPEAVAKRLLEQDTWEQAKPTPAPKKAESPAKGGDSQ